MKAFLFILSIQKMKNISVTTFLLLALGMATAQLSIDRQVIGNAGVRLQNGNLSTDFTLGESWVTVLSDGQLTVQQGFHQGYSGPAASIYDMYEDTDLVLFPQPADASLHLRFHDLPQERLRLRLYNLMGQQVLLEAPEIVPLQGQKEVSVKHLSPGPYLLQLVNPEGAIVFQKKWWKS
jgi:hypothetical protein